MLTVKLQDIVQSARIIQDICGPRGKCLGTKAARYLGVPVASAVEAVVRDFDSARDAIIESYEHLNEGGVPEVPPDRYEDFNSKIGALLDQPRDLLHLFPISDTELAPLALTPAEWRLLDWLVEPQLAPGD